jgi:hypothetical protein
MKDVVVTNKYVAMAIKNIIVAIMNKWWSIEKPVVAINNNGP